MLAGWRVDAALYAVSSSSLAVWAWYRVRSVAPSIRRGWRMIASGLVLHVIATGISHSWDGRGELADVVIDVFALAPYLPLFAGLWFLVRRTTSERILDTIIDLAIGATVAATALWELVLSPHADHRFDGTVFGLAEPFLGASLVVLTLALILRPGKHRRAAVIFGAAVLMHTVADGSRIVLLIHDIAPPDLALDLGHLFLYVGGALAASAAARDGGGPAGSALPGFQISVYGVGLLAIPAIRLVSRALDHDIVISAETIVGGAVLGTLVITRIILLFLDLERRRGDLHNLRERMRITEEVTSDLVTLHAGDGTILYGSPGLYSLLGYENESKTGANPFELIHPDDLLRVVQAFLETARRPGTAPPETFRIQAADGSWRWVETIGTNQLQNPSLKAIVVTTRDVTQRVEAAATLLEVEARFRAVFDQALEPMAILGLDGCIIEGNEALIRFAGCAGAELLGASPAEFGETDRESWGARVSKHARSPNAQIWTEEVWTRPDGSVAVGRAVTSTIKGADQEPAMIVLAIEDLTELREVTSRLSYKELFDGTTGLPNRAQFRSRLEAALRAANADGHSTGILFLDVDRFSDVNDLLGPLAGDAILRQVAERLRALLREGDVIARYSGDEFVIFVQRVQMVDVEAVVNRIRSAWREPFAHADGENVYLTASVGVVVAGPNHVEVDGLIQDAHAAECVAKEAGPGRWQVFDAGLRDRSIARVRLEAELRRAFERSEFCLHYQPVVRIADGAIVGFESLVRWRHPERGLVMPGAFLEAMGRAGLEEELGRWTLVTAMRQVAEWGATFGDALRVGMNFSPAQLEDPELLALLERMMAESPNAGRSLVFEVTEHALMRDGQSGRRIMEAINAWGARIYVDDFGTGYSSLAYLHRFPVYGLKIDRSFVNELAEHDGNGEMVRAIIAMARALDLRVVAEGVEEPAQLERLRALGCDMVQGYLLDKPMEPSAVGALLERQIGRSRVAIA